ncbi:hypothetical protein ASZ90_014473 [hydrocarbon metagenome]|uniref:Sporulation protein YtfJ n=2 Tax=root TaxID=1 RepID=A0A0W8F4Y6_9ZZZZ
MYCGWADISVYAGQDQLALSSLPAAVLLMDLPPESFFIHPRQYLRGAEDMEGLTDILKTITTEMQKSLSPRTAVGDPITVEGKTIVPLMSVGMGFGAGSGTGKETDPAGGAGGGGLGMKPIAVVIIDQQGVRIERMKESRDTLVDHLAEAIPRFVENISRKKESRVEIEGSSQES